MAIVDALRPAQIATHHPGEAVVRAADVVVVNKIESAGTAATQSACDGVRALRPDVPIVRAASPVRLDDPGAVAGRRCVVVDDGPTLTHGGMPHGAGWVAAVGAGAMPVDPRPWAVGPIREAFDAYPHLGPVLPALGYGPEQCEALAQTLQAVEADVVVSGTPLDLARLVRIDKPIVRARYGFRDGDPSLADQVDPFLARCAREAARTKP